MLNDVDAHAECLDLNESSLDLLLRVPFAADVATTVGVCQQRRPFKTVNSGEYLRLDCPAELRRI